MRLAGSLNWSSGCTDRSLTLNEVVRGQVLNKHQMSFVPLVSFDQELNLVLVQVLVFGAKSLVLEHQLGRYVQLVDDELFALCQLHAARHILGYVQLNVLFASLLVTNVHEDED